MAKTEEGQVALGESHLELSDSTEKYKKKTDDTIADSKHHILYMLSSFQKAP